MSHCYLVFVYQLRLNKYFDDVMITLTLNLPNNAHISCCSCPQGPGHGDLCRDMTSQFGNRPFWYSPRPCMRGNSIYCVMSR